MDGRDRPRPNAPQFVEITSFGGLASDGTRIEDSVPVVDDSSPASGGYADEMGDGLDGWLKPPPNADAVRQPPGQDPWTTSWVRACDENKKWLAMGYCEDSRHYPWCLLCGKWAEEEHLRGPKCAGRRERFSVSMGPFLTELLAKGASKSEPSPGEHEPKFANAPPPVAAPRPKAPPPNLRRPKADNRQRCRNEHCTYLAHPETDEFQGYCCKACKKWLQEGYKRKTYHGQRCLREPAPDCVDPSSVDSAPPPKPAPPSHPPVAKATRFVPARECEPESEMEPVAARKLQVRLSEPRTFRKLTMNEGIPVSSGVDPSAPEATTNFEGSVQVVGEAVMIVCESTDESVEVLRAPIRDGWITLAERGDRLQLCSRFAAPPCGWHQAYASAKFLDKEWKQPDDTWQELQQALQRFDSVQQELKQQLHEHGTCDPATLDHRNELRRQALEMVRDYQEQVREASARSCEWYGGPLREERSTKARQSRNQLEESSRLDVNQELKLLMEQRTKVIMKKNATLLADAEWKLARDMQQTDLPEKEEQRNEARRQEKLATRAYFEVMARLCRFASTSLPELLPELGKHTEKTIQAELRKLNAADQAEVRQVLDENISLSHYEPQLSKAKRLSSEGGRHAIYEMKYDFTPCVIKVFDFASCRGLPGFVQEVMLHTRLRHPLIVPLRKAFLDLEEHRGFLQFDRYTCNLADYLQQLQKPRRRPHNFGEPAEAGLVDDRMPCRIAHTMTQSVAHIHAHGVVHGDLKPSNWLWDARQKAPCLCDFETAKDQNRGTTTAAKTTGRGLHTPGYLAPELLKDPCRPRTMEADVFALGRSVEEVLQAVPETRPTERAELTGFVERMLCEDPSQRISATVAAQAWWNEALSSTDGYEHLVKCKEVLYSQGECSRQFRDGQSFQQLIEAIVQDPEYPLKEDRLIIEVVRKGGALLSVDNRRLYCFHEAQNKLYPETVWIRIREHQHSMVQERFQSHFSTRNGGRSIHVRGLPPPRRPPPGHH